MVTDIASFKDLMAGVKGTPSPNDRLIETLQRLKPNQPRNDGYPQDPLIFMRDVLGLDLWEKQQEIVLSVWENRYTSVASCHGIGKSFVTAAIIITFLHLHENSIVLSTAPTGRQVEMILWRNIKHIYKNAKRPLLGNPPLTVRYDIADSWYAMGFKPSDQETDPAQGFHADKVLVVIDEAAGVAPTLIDGFMAAMTSEYARLLKIGNPTSTNGPFYDSHHSKSDMYNAIVVAWPDTPNFTREPGDRGYRSYLITKQWVEDIRQKYGEDSPYYRSRVMAEWVSAEGVLIPADLIDSARERALVAGDQAGESIEAGVDVARDGKDKSVLTVRRGAKVLLQKHIRGRTAFDVSGAVIEQLNETIVGAEKLPIRIKVDEVGLGSGTLDVLKDSVDNQLNLPWIVRGVNFGKRARDPEAYLNQRCEAYGLLAQRFRDGDIWGAINDDCRAELSDLRGKNDTRHTQPVIEPKDDFRKRVGNSPDYADSLALAFYNPPADNDTTIGVLSFGYAEHRWGRI